MLRDPCSDAEDHDLRIDASLIGLHGLHVPGLDVVSGDLDATSNVDSVALAHLDEPGNGLGSSGVAAQVLVQHYVYRMVFEVGPDRTQVLARILSDIHV